MYLRKGNLQFQAAQNNQNKSLTIENFKKAIDDRREGDYFGYEKDQVMGQDFRLLLPEEVREILEDNIEFTMDGTDFKNVMEKIINFKIINNNQKQVEMNVHIERDLGRTQDMLFTLTLERKIFLREKIKFILNSIGAIQNTEHQKTGLINEETFTLVLDEVMDFLFEAEYDGVLCMISLEGFPIVRRNLGKEGADELLFKIANVLKSTLRGRDVVGYLGLGKFAIVMARTFEDETVYPLKRLEANFMKTGILKGNVSFNARFKKLDLELEAASMIELVKNKAVDYTMTS